MGDLFGLHLPQETEWTFEIPKYLAQVRKKQSSLLTLDIHAIAYSTYLANADKDVDEDIRYEMSYLLAWMYEFNPSDVEKARSILFKQNNMIIGSGEVEPRKTKAGMIITDYMRTWMDEDTFETDEEFVARVDNDAKAKFALAVENLEEYYSYDDEFTRCYLRLGPNKAFKSFLRKTFLHESFITSAQGVIGAFKLSISEDELPGQTEALEHFKMSLSKNESVRRCASLFVQRFENINTYLATEEVSHEIVQAVSNDLETVAEDLDVSSEELKQTTPVTIITLNAYSNLLNAVSVSMLLNTLGYVPNISTTEDLMARHSWRHYCIIKDMKGRFKTQMFFGYHADLFFTNLRKRYLASVSKHLENIIPIK